LLLNQGFAGKQRLMPYLNRQNNDDLILAVQSAGVKRGRNGFCKNKSTEKNPEPGRRIYWSTASMARMLLIRCILGVRSLRSMIFMVFLWVV